MPQVDGFQIVFTLLTNVQSVQSFIITEIGQGILVCGAAEWALQPLKKPLSITAGAYQPPGTTFYIQETEVCIASTDWAIVTPPALLLYQVK